VFRTSKVAELVNGANAEQGNDNFYRGKGRAVAAAAGAGAGPGAAPVAAAAAPKRARPMAMRGDVFEKRANIGQVANIDAINQAVVDGISQICTQMVGNAALVGEIKLSAALPVMRDYPPGTMFAVLVDGHWTYAECQASEQGPPKIQFKDYQTDHAGTNSGPTCSDLPMIGIAGRTIDNMDLTATVVAVTPRRYENQVMARTTETPTPAAAAAATDTPAAAAASSASPASSSSTSSASTSTSTE